MSSTIINMKLSIFFVISTLVFHFSCGQYHFSSATAGVNFENIAPSHAAGNALTQTQNVNRPRQRRMYAMCPPNFQRIGQECFTYPQQNSSWLEAHFFCKDKNARLAEPEKYSDRKLREFLLKNDAESGDKDPIWIGATYDYVNNVWQWSISGRNLTYNAFSKKYFEHNTNMDNQCAVYDPQLRYRWSSRTCVDKHRFICQHKMPKVSENNRHKVYHRWNASYPNQYANEVVLEVIDHRGKGRYNRRVIAEGSNEEMVVPSRPRNRQHTRRRPRPTSASLPQENDINYQPQTSAHPNDIQQHFTPTKHPIFSAITLVPTSSTNNYNNEIAAPKEATTTIPDIAERKARRRTMQDRKLQRQREKELRRMQRKKERQEKMRREKEERLRNMRLERDEQRRKMKEERQRRIKQQRELEELRQREGDQTVERQQRERQLQDDRQQEIENLRRQKEAEEKKHLEDLEEERRRQAYLHTLKEKEEQERARKEEIKKIDREHQMAEEQRLKEERKALEERKRKEYEQKLKEAENERAKQLAEEQERKRLQDESDRSRLEEEERLRQAELKKQLEEEEERLRLNRLEEERIAEEKELERLREEQRKRAEIQRKREEEIARLEAEQRRIEREEAHIKEELEESERQAKLMHEAEIRKAEEEVRTKEEERKRAEEQEEHERQEKLRVAKIIEDSRKQQNIENVSSNLKNRLASLSPELRKEFLEKRKQRKREKLLREKVLRQQQQQAESTNNEA